VYKLREKNNITILFTYNILPIYLKCKEPNINLFYCINREKNREEQERCIAFAWKNIDR